MKASLALLLALALLASLAHGQVVTGVDGAFGFVYRNVLGSTPSNLGHGGNIRPATSAVWPALKGTNVGIVTLQLEPNATHLPHWHRSYELLFVINGNLTVGITSFNTSIGVVEYNLTNGDALIVETAAAHYVHNRGPGRSINLSAFNSDNPGTQVSSQTLFDFPDTVVQTAIQVDTSVISQLRAAKAVTPALYDGQTIAAQAATQTGNFTQSLSSLTANLTGANTPVAAAPVSSATSPVASASSPSASSPSAAAAGR